MTTAAARPSTQAHHPQPPAEGRSGWSALALFTPSAGYFALFAVAASWVLPFEGVGFDLCALHRVTGLPCPGCGLTRAFIAVASGDLAVAVAANPFVLLLYPLFVVLAALILLPDGMRRGLERLCARQARGLGAAYRVGVTSFLGFGALRLLYFLVLGERFP